MYHIVSLYSYSHRTVGQYRYYLCFIRFKFGCRSWDCHVIDHLKSGSHLFLIIVWEKGRPLLLMNRSEINISMISCFNELWIKIEARTTMIVESKGDDQCFLHVCTSCRPWHIPREENRPGFQQLNKRLKRGRKKIALIASSNRISLQVFLNHFQLLKHLPSLMRMGFHSLMLRH